MNNKTKIIFGVTILIFITLFSMYFLYTQKKMKDWQQKYIPHQVEKEPIESDTTYPKELTLKNIAFISCLKEMSSSTTFWKNENSAGGYVELSDTSVEQLREIDDFAKKYAIDRMMSNNGDSYNNKDLWLMKCLDFYNSKVLDQEINKLKDDQHSQ